MRCHLGLAFLAAGRPAGAVERRDIFVTYLGMDPVVFNAIRGDPRFGALLERIGMAEVAR
jgi:hypothetical protein